MKKFIIFALVAILSIPMSAATENNSSTSTTEQSFDRGKGKKKSKGFNYKAHKKKGAKLGKAAAGRVKSNGGDLTKKICPKKKKRK